MPYPLSANVKILRANEHLQSLELAIARWLNMPPYIVTSYEDDDVGLHICRVDLRVSDNAIPALLGDFICNLRSCLEHLAWQLAHLSPRRALSKRQIRSICFPVFGERDSTYEIIRGVFPSTVAVVLDDLQPFKRGTAFPDHPLWQLHELWNLDKHQTIPVSPASMILTFPRYGGEYCGRMSVFDDHLEVRFPLSVARNCPVKFEPQISIEVLFGVEGRIVVSWERLREIYDFVRNDVIPRFARFFT
jgi:hypothetical protein